MKSTVAKRKPKKKTVPSKVGNESTLLSDELDRQATLLVAAYQLISDLESRSGDEIVVGVPLLNPAERQLLTEALPWLEDNHRIAEELKKSRRARQLRESGASRSAVAQSQIDLDHATKAIKAATAEVDSIDANSGELLIDHLNRQQAKLDALRDAAREAEADLNNSRNDYDRLLACAPKPLRDFVEQCLKRSNVPALKSQQSRIERSIATVTSAIKILASVDVAANGDNARFHQTAWHTLPDAVSVASNGRDFHIDEAMCHSQAEKLRTKNLPALEHELQAKVVEIESESERVREPLHRWAEAGELTVGMVLNSPC